MADINFDCPHCGHNLDVNERGAGLTVACPECSKNIEIPIPVPKLFISDIIFNCGSCGQPLKAAPDMAGQLIDCPACKKPTEIPFAPRPTPPTPTHPAAIGMPIPKSPSQRQVPGFGTRNPAAPAATRPPKAASPGLVVAVIFLALVCAGLAAGMFFLIKNRNGGSTTAQGTSVAPTKENVGLARRIAEKVSLAEKAMPDITVDGEVFIVTKGGQSLKLGLVEVVLIPMQTLVPYLEKKHTTLTNELPGLEQQIKTALEEMGRLSEASIVAENKWSDANRKDFLHQMDDIIDKAHKSASNASSNESSNASSNELDALDKARKSASNASDNALEEMLKLRNQKNKLLSESFYFDSMPSPLSVTKTNSDGRFRLLTPGSGSFAVAAIASRHVGDDVERYYWLLKIDPRAGANQTIMLSNDNLMTSDGVGIFLQTNR